MSTQIAMETGHDRRQRRSLELIEALHFQLLHATEMFELDLMTLSSCDGELMAQSASPDSDILISETVAAFSPMLADGKRHTNKGRLAEERLFDALAQLDQTWRADALLVCEFYAGGKRLCLSAIGGDEETRELILYRVIFGIRRIFNQMMG